MPSGESLRNARPSEAARALAALGLQAVAELGPQQGGLVLADIRIAERSLGKAGALGESAPDRGEVGKGAVEKGRGHGRGD